MLFRRLFLFLNIILFGAHTALAQNVDDYVTVTEVPDWVVEAELPKYKKSDYVNRDSFYELVEWQSRFDQTTDAFFVRYAQVFQTVEGVEQNANVHISLDPEFERINLHYVRVRRDGKYIDKTDLSEFVIYRKETDRSKLIFDGTLEATYIVPDVRAGDMLEVAYTNVGRNPAFGPHFSVRYQQSFNDVLLKFVHRILVHEDMDYKTKAYVDAQRPRKKKFGDYEELYWELKIPEPVHVDDNTPGWLETYPSYRVSSFKTWKDVGVFFAPNYATPENLPDDLKQVRDDIMREHKTQKERTRAALAFVQSNIRYFGIELGVGGYHPRPIDKIMRRRYGDCKDMTVLLVALLQSMDIEAYPLLVDSENNQIKSSDFPRHSAFNHVVAYVKFGNHTYVLDPTRGEQIGDLDHLRQGTFTQGVIIDQNSPGLVDLDLSDPEFFEIYHDRYDLVSEAPDILFTSRSTYYQSSADSILSWYNSSGLDHMEREYLKYYKDAYPSIIQDGDMRMDMDEDEGKITISVDYRIKDDWEHDSDEDQYTYDLYVRDIDDKIPAFVGADRTLPYAFSYPVKTKHIMDMIINDDWYFDSEKYEADLPAYKFSKTSTYSKLRFRESYEFVSKSDHIKPEDFEESMSKLSDIDDMLGISLLAPDNLKSDQDKKKDDRKPVNVMDSIFDIMGAK